MSVGFTFPAGQIWDLNGLHVLEFLLVQFLFMSHFLLKLSARLEEERPCLKRQGTALIWSYKQKNTNATLRYGSGVALALKHSLGSLTETMLACNTRKHKAPQISVLGKWPLVPEQVAP